jgi:hypothetical protein
LLVASGNKTSRNSGEPLADYGLVVLVANKTTKPRAEQSELSVVALAALVLKLLNNFEARLVNANSRT